jgi:hypothetical protein
MQGVFALTVLDSITLDTMRTVAASFTSTA